MVMTEEDKQARLRELLEKPEAERIKELMDRLREKLDNPKTTKEERDFIERLLKP
jgi:hypothetical protein